MRFTENRIDCYNGFVNVNGIFFEHIHKIIVGLAEIYIYRNNQIICFIPIDNLYECTISEIIENKGDEIETEHKNITKWLKNENNLNLQQLSNALNNKS